MSTLPATIPGLIEIFPAPVFVSDKSAIAACPSYQGGEEYELYWPGCRPPMLLHPRFFELDLTAPIGRFIAASWLLERGHNCDWMIRHLHGAALLRCSVVRVSAGMGPVVSVVEPWVGNVRAVTEVWVYGAFQHLGAQNRDRTMKRLKGAPEPYDWYALGCKGTEAAGAEAAKAAADASLLARGHALTNADGTLTLPPEAP